MAVWDRPVCGLSPSPSPLGVNGRVDLPALPTYGLGSGIPSPDWPTLLRPPIAQTLVWWQGNINPFPITYAFRPRLRGRLTLGRLALPRKPWAYGERVFHPLYRYSCHHSHFHPVHQSSRSGFNPDGTLPYRHLDPEIQMTRSFGEVLKPR